MGSLTGTGMRGIAAPVFITGGTGYIGRPLIEALLRQRCAPCSGDARVHRGSRGGRSARQSEWDSRDDLAALVHPGVRPWWPSLLLPVYAILRRIPTTRAGAERLGLVTCREMTAALVRAIETPPSGTVRIMEVPEIRQGTA